MALAEGLTEMPQAGRGAGQSPLWHGFGGGPIPDFLVLLSGVGFLRCGAIFGWVAGSGVEAELDVALTSLKKAVRVQPRPIS